MTFNTAFSGYIARIKHFNPNAHKFLLYTFFLSLNTGIYGVIFNLYILKLGYREDLLGLMLSIISISTGLFAIPAAMICDNIGKKNTLLVSSLILAFSMVFLYTMATQEVLLIMSVFYGVAMSFSVVAGAPFMAENSTRENRMYLFSINSVILMIAMIAGNLIGGIMPGLISAAIGTDIMDIMPYRFTLYLSLAAVMMTLIPVLYINETERMKTVKAERFKVLSSVLKSRNVQRLVLINSLIGIGAGMIVPFFNVYFHKVLSAEADQIGIIFSAAQLTMIAALIILPYLTEKFGKVKTIALTELFSIPFLIIIALTANIYMAAFAYIMRMTLMNMANPAINSFNMEIVSDKQRATVNSLTSMGWNIFLAISTYLSGVMMANSNYTLPYIITCVVYFIAALLYYRFFVNIEKVAMNGVIC
ncbi:MFS transporter [Methanocella sp. CWC-04]|uniref:MFS transporter n=1 Tax=Methanooceanicella nereidis TaxID=2052831 RepID=A0AAP2RBQ9_9EURY|nr:MFS transporter [Methanocella sp. CWC-04]